MVPWLGPRGWFGIVAIVVVAVTVWVLYSTNGATLPAPAGTDAASAQPAPSPDAQPDLAPTASPIREAASDALPSDALPDDGVLRDAPHGSLRGRCVAAENGQPLPGCEVTLDDGPRRTVVTNADGIFLLEVDPQQPANLGFSGPQRADRRLSVDPPEAGKAADLGDVALALGFTITGRVVDTNGTAVPKVVVFVHGFDSATDGRLSSTMVAGTSDEDGNFVLSPALGAGRWHVQLMRGGLQEPNTFDVDPLTGAPPLLLVVAVAETRTIRGVVVDEVGDPVSGVVLQTNTTSAMAHTGADGSFVLQTEQATPNEDRLIVCVPGRCESDTTPRPVWWGSNDVRIVLQRAASLTVEVVDDAGVPVTGFGVWLGRQPLLVPGEEDSREHGEHEHGRATVASVRRGPNLLRVFPHAEDLVASEPIEIDVVDAMPSIRVVLERAHPCPVEVVTVTGEPVASAKIELVRMRADPDGSLGEVRVPGKGGKTTLWYPRHVAPEWIADAQTDAQGRASLCAPRTRRGLLLRCDVPPFVPFHAVEPALQPGVPLRVVLIASGAIAGTLALGGRPDSAFRIELCHADGASVDVRDPRLVDLATDGSFAIERLVPGTWRLAASRQVLWKEAHEARVSYVPLPATERTVVVVAGETTKVELVAPADAPSTLRGHVHCDAQDLAGWTVDLVRTDVASRHGSFAVAADGTFVAANVMPGSYRLALLSPNAMSNHLGAILADAFELAPNEQVVREFEFVPRRLALDLEHPDGSPVTGAWDLRCGAEIRSGGVGSPCVLDPAPELPIQVRLQDGGEWSPPFAAPRDRRETTRTIVVPQGKPKQGK